MIFYKCSKISKKSGNQHRNLSKLHRSQRSVSILTDNEALESNKEKSRPLYAKSCNQFKEYFQADKLETQVPSETQLLSYFNYMRVEKNRASSSL